MEARLESIARCRYVPWLAVLLLAIRFAGPSVSASFGVRGYNTAPLDAFFQVYAALLPLAATFLVAALLPKRPAAAPGPWLPLVFVFVVWTVAFWAGEADSAYRIVSGPWATLPLGLGVTGAILAYGAAMEGRMSDAATGTVAGQGFRALYGSFALAYLLGALRFIDYRTALGGSLPSGVLWFLNYGPTLLPCFISLAFWVRLTWPRSTDLAGAVRSFALPTVGALVGFVVAQGLGGFILSNVLAWGGAYEVFVPTSLSLAIVGFAVGAFLATAWSIRSQMRARAWRFVVGGVSATGFAGILFFDGAIASLAGILLGLTLVVRGFADPVVSTT